MNSNFESIAMTSFRAFALGFALLVFGHSAAFAAAGKIQFTAGEVKIVNAQKAERVAQKGEALESGDTIVTGASGSVQVALADGGLIAVRPNSQLKIDDYAYSGKADDSKNKSIFSLGKGTFRSITGAIGQNNKQAYRVNTPTATMGIRGTDHEPAVVLPLPPLPPDLQALTPLQLAPPGTYDRVNSGETFIQNSEGLVFLGPNQVGFAPAGGGSPIALPNVPGFYTNTPKTNPAKAAADAKKSASASGGAGSTSTSSTTSESTASSENTGTAVTSETVETIVPSPAENPSLVTSQIATTNTTLIAASGAPPPLTRLAPLGSGLVGAVVDLFPGDPGGSGSVLLVASPPTQEILLGSQNEVLRIFDGLVLPTFEFLSNNSSLTDQGAFISSDGGRVDWGRWTPGYTILDDGVPASTVGDFHYIFSENITDPNLVTNASGGLVGGTYGYAGGTQPTNFAGVPGAILPGQTFLSVDFTMQSVGLGVGTLINGTTLIGSASGSIQNFITPDVGIVGIGPVLQDLSSNRLRASGFFIGPTAAGAITSFDITNISSQGVVGEGAVGTAVFDRSVTPPPPASPPPLF